MQELPKRFELEQQEKIYNLWEKGGYFIPKKDPKKKPFTIIMPPPNANGSLHIGHAVFVTLEDIMIRYNRMKGVPTLWLPGADHAGIQTQVVFEKKLEKKRKTRFDLGREEFFKETYKFTMENKKTMENQLRKLGASCDWTREHFTLESDISKAVLFTFKRLYDDGLVYKGKRIINWCPRCGTALSDLEVIYKERDSKLFYIKYPVENEKDKFITVATTRPETMLGDTAVAVNPADKRYKNLVGKNIILPLMDRTIPVVTDKVVDMEFGTGAVKVTPSHDPVDFEIAQRHNLEFIDVIGKDKKMTKNAKGYAGLKTTEARKKILEDLRKLNLLEKEEDYKHSVGTCERCKSIIEPLFSKQWFVKIKPLAEKAIKAVKNKEIKIVPSRYEKVFFNWMENIRDWCISRQIWWGQQIPVYYCMDCKEIMVELEKPKKCKCGSTNIKQDPDTFDTWFSSGQWPYTTLGWNEEVFKGKKSKDEDFEYFYPTSVMETGWDILFFWVSRMIMFGLYSTGKVPFKTVVLHGLVRDKDRQKMSKSKGNVIDPLGIIDIYGSDALRMALVFGTGVGNDIIISEEKIKGFRNFTTKIWNASRYVLSNINLEAIKKINSKDLKLTKEDKWILKELDKTETEVTDALEKYHFHRAAELIYEFFWHKFADKTIEDTKSRIYGDISKEEKQTAQWVLHRVLTESLKNLHPFMPFVTEAVWQNLEEEKPLIVSEWSK